MTFKNFKFCRCSYIVNTNRTIMSSHRKSLAFAMECNHREDAHHVLKNTANLLVRILSQSQIIRIKASQQNLYNFDQISLYYCRVTIYKVSQNFKYIFLEFKALSKICSMVLYLHQELISTGAPRFHQHFSRLMFEEKLTITLQV